MDKRHEYMFHQGDIKRQIITRKEVQHYESLEKYNLKTSVSYHYTSIRMAKFLKMVTPILVRMWRLSHS